VIGGGGESLLAVGAAVSLVAAVTGIVQRVRRSAMAVGTAVNSAVDRQLADAFIFVDGARLLRLSAMLAIVLAVLAYAMHFGLVASLVLAAALLAGPGIALRILRRRRQSRVLRQLPDAMQSLAALLRAGQSLGQALATLAETQPRPLRDEWRLLLRRLRMGERPDVVFEQLPRRIEAPESRMFATTIRVAIDLGGSLAEALENLATATRRRLEMQSRIRALTSQGRLQGAIVGALPLIMVAVLSAMDAQAMSLLWTRPAGWAALGVLMALEICGFILIRRIVRIDV
jgi:tight adherence protein B